MIDYRLFTGFRKPDKAFREPVFFLFFLFHILRIKQDLGD